MAGDRRTLNTDFPTVGTNILLIRGRVCAETLRTRTQQSTARSRRISSGRYTYFNACFVSFSCASISLTSAAATTTNQVWFCYFIGCWCFTFVFIDTLNSMYDIALSNCSCLLPCETVELQPTPNGGRALVNDMWRRHVTLILVPRGSSGPWVFHLDIS